MKTSYYCKPGLKRFPLFPLKAVVLQIRQLHSFIFFLNFLKGVKFRGLKKICILLIWMFPDLFVIG